MRLRTKTQRRVAQRYNGPQGEARQQAEVLPVSPERPAQCSVCQGGVKIVKAIFSDAANGIVSGRTPVLGNHGFGGRAASSTRVRCPGSGLPE